MKKLLFVLPLLAAFVMMGAPVASADDAVELAIQAALGTDPAGVNTVAGITRSTLDELRSYYADLKFQLLDEFSGGSRTVGWLSRQAFNTVFDINAQIVDPATAPVSEGGRSIGWMSRQAITEIRDLQADVDSLQQDVAILQASVDEVIALLKTPQGRRDGWNQ